ncbi:hypothetical protein JXA85_06645 [Candidatus Woesearchaeota archaeon]|nr:hypothetical protein [Candidatus Woesearchaeota archaeon]
MPDESLEDIEREVRRKLSSIGLDGNTNLDLVSGSFQEFQKEEREEHSFRNFYEKYCGFASQTLSFLKIKPSDKSRDSMQDDIDVCGYNVRPDQVVVGAMFALGFAFLASLPFFILGWKDFALFIVCTGLFMSYVVYTYPGFYSQIIKMRAQEESILAILYMTIYMRVNPVLENAMYFATQHLNGPLGKDLKQMLWMLDMGKADTVEEAIKHFMDLWVKRNPDFVKSFLTLYSVLNQTDEENREKILEKSLSTILDSTYTKMKHYSHDLKTPVLVLHTFGMMLPLIGMIAFPMLSIFMAGEVKMHYVFFGYIVVLPALLWFLTQRILSKRPGAFSFPDLTDNPYLPPKGRYLLVFKDKKYLVKVVMFAVIIGVIFMMPGLFWVSKHTMPAVIKMQMMDKSTNVNMAIGDVLPQQEYTLTAMVFTLTIPAGLALIFIIYFYFTSVQRLKMRNSIAEIEDDLDESLFQLGNQFTDEIPVEVGLKKYLSDSQLLNLKKRHIFKFFKEVVDRIENEGVTFVTAVFEKGTGIIVKYPSILMKEIMWIIIEGTKKGAKTLYNIMTKISIYLGNTKKIKELIYDLLTDTVSSINIQAKFLSPFLASVVGSLTFVIVRVLAEMAKKLEGIMRMLNFGANGSDNFFTDMINFTKIYPPTVFQILVGIYLIETVMLMSILSSGVQNGFDKVSRDYTIAKNLLTAIILYALFIIVAYLSLEGLVQGGIQSIKT